MLTCSGIVLSDRGPGLHRIADQPVVDELDPCNMVRPLECGLGCFMIAELPVVADIVGDLVKYSRRTSIQRTSHAGDGRKNLVVNSHGHSGVTRSRQRVGDYERYRIADMPH